jgi:hypothetical protein
MDTSSGYPARCWRITVLAFIYTVAYRWTIADENPGPGGQRGGLGHEGRAGRFHYPSHEFHDEMLRRVGQAAEFIASSPGCLEADCWLTEDGQAIVSTGQWESEEAFRAGFAAARAAGIDFRYDEREVRPARSSATPLPEPRPIAPCPLPGQPPGAVSRPPYKPHRARASQFSHQRGKYRLNGRSGGSPPP